MASVYADLGLAYSLKADYTQGIADGYANTGYVHTHYAEFPEAIEALNTALDQYEAFHDSSGIANCSHLLGIIYEHEQKYDSALIFINRSLELQQQLNHHASISADLYSKGYIYSSMQKYDSAISVFSRIVAFEKQGGDSMGVARALSELAGTYIESGEAETGLNYRVAALKKLSSKDLDSSSPEVLKFKAYLLNQMAGDYFLQNDQGKAIKTGLEGLAIARQINAREEKHAAYKTLAELYGLTGREDIQLQFMEQYILLNDSLLKEETQLRVAAEKMKYAFASNEKELADQNVIALNEQLSTEKQEGSRRIMLMWILIAALLAVAVGAVMYARKRTGD